MEHWKERVLMITTLLFVCVNVSKAIDCELNFNDPRRVAYTVYVDKSGRGNFRTIQSAIDSIPFKNNKWIRIHISPGIYWEKVVILQGKSCIFLDGAGNEKTEIQWNDHTTTASSATFTSMAENLVVQGITFRNTHNAPGSVRSVRDIVPALAAFIQGDKSTFYRCRFIGLQDTLWDGFGRHHFINCYIEGVIDVISGNGQSIYQKCKINIPVNAYGGILNHGYITAQGRDKANDSNGFVFNQCTIEGSGRIYLGRAYRAFSTVIFHLSFLPSSIDPAGWHIWQQAGHEMSLTYAEAGCYGPGSDTSRRVPWTKKLNRAELMYFTQVSFIDREGWTSRLPLLF